MDVLYQRQLSSTEYYSYAEKTNLYSLFQHMLSEIIVNQPDDPISFLQELLARGYRDTYRVIILGPPVIDRKQVCWSLHKRLRLVHLTSNNLVKYADEEMKSLLEQHGGADDISDPFWVKLVKSRVEKPDCVKRGWILEGIPQTREQAFLMLKTGVFPTHIVFLEFGEEEEIFDAVCIQIESLKGETNTFRAEKSNLISFFKKAHMKRFKITSDISLLDQVEEFVREKEKTFGLHVPRIILFGPRGSRRREMASLLSDKYGIVVVDFQEILKQASLVENNSFIGDLTEALQSQEPVPDDLLARVVAERLLRPDCVEKGWVMFDFPFNFFQAELLAKMIEGFQANMTIFLEVSLDTCLSRLEPVRFHMDTGETYHLEDDPPSKSTDPEKLFQRPEDTRDELEASYNAYSQYKVALQGYYSRNFGEDLVTTIDGTENTKNVFDLLDSYVSGSMRRKIPSTKWWEWSSRNTGIF